MATRCLTQKKMLMGKDKNPYPTPRKGERVVCLACNGSGTIAHARKGGGFIYRSCGGCGGKGYINA